MEAPGVLEEQAEVGRHRRLAAEDVRQGRPLGARRVRSLERLVELLRVAEQDEAVRGRRDRDDVGQRDLAGLVHEQDVDRSAIFGAPTATRAGRELARRRRARARTSRRILRRASPRVVDDLVLVGLLDGRDVTPLDRRGLERPPSSRLPMTLWLVAVIPTRLPAASSEQIIRAPV